MVILFPYNRPVGDKISCWYLQKRDARALYCDHAHRLVHLEVQDQDLTGIEQQHVAPFGRQIGQLQAIVEGYELSAEKNK